MLLQLITFIQYSANSLHMFIFFFLHTNKNLKFLYCLKVITYTTVYKQSSNIKFAFFTLLIGVKLNMSLYIYAKHSQPV